MIVKLFSIILSFGLLYYVSLYSCPFTITNDGDVPILVVDPHGDQAVRIMPQQAQVIDPTIMPVEGPTAFDRARYWLWEMWKPYAIDEKLNFYEQVAGHEDLFLLKYQLIEKYCTEHYKTENNLTYSQIKGFIADPTQRLSTRQIKIPAKKHADHAH